MAKHLTFSGFIVLAFLMTIGMALAAPCDIRAPDPVIRHVLGSSYCELCGTGYITIVVSNPYDRRTSMTGMTVVENLGTTGLTFDTSASPSIWINNDSRPTAAPVVSGANGSILTWTSAQIAELADLAANSPPSVSATITIRFAVTRHSNLTHEGLATLPVANRRIQASLEYTAEDTGPTPDVCPGTWPVTEFTGWQTLDLREPDPRVRKRGRNVDAAQTRYTTTVYGHDYDDVIWRIRVRNNGDADLQDLGLDDVMEAGNLNISYICPSEAAAEQIAIANNGAGPSTMGCIAVVGNSVSDFDVDDPFGEPPTGPVDVPRGANTNIFLVGKVPVSAPGIGACSVPRTNTVSDIRWGCESDGTDNPGGIDSTSEGSPPADVTATLRTFSNSSGLDIQTEYVGTNTTGPDQAAGSKATVRITINNNTGGTITGINLTNTLPAGYYVVDPTFDPTITTNPAYGAYDGMTDRIEWTNPVTGTYPTLTTTDPAVALSNTEPEFRLYSSTTNTNGSGPDQVDLLRHGDQLIVEFRIVLIRSLSYDKAADLDVRTEIPADGTDPDHASDLANLRNRLVVEYENFCQPGVTRSETVNTTHTPDPEDLDVDINGSVLDFILTDNPNQELTLTVELTNNGGHQAEDYIAYVAFGRTMEVDPTSVPAGCLDTTPNRPPLEEWQDPNPIPAGATVYECTGNAILPGATRSFSFDVTKSNDNGDIEADDLTFRADVFGEIVLSDGATLLWFPTPVNPRADTGTDRANNYSLDAIRARVIGFNLEKTQVGDCSENNPPPGSPDLDVQIGEECTYHVKAGGWFGFKTPGYALIAVQDVRINDVLPDGQGYVSSTDPRIDSTDTDEVPPGQININTLVFGRDSGPAPPSYTLPGDLEEGALYWNFNVVDQIITIEQWFEVELTSRLLNDPVDLSADPNQHANLSTNMLNSTFAAIFDDGSGSIQHTLDENTVGYPIIDVRRIDLTVTEPNITVVKEVCNESLSGVQGPGCSPWETLADDGDALNDYIYRLTVTNEAGSSGVTRAPAYDVTVTDTLDASDLAYVLPFDSDGLNNDGDGAFDEAGVGSEGSISNNTVNAGGPAVITFSHDHSTALERIDPGDSVRLYYRVDFDDDAAPLQTFTNSAVATYDSLEGPTGSQTAGLERPNSDIAGARVYTSAAATADVQIIPIEAQPKRITNLSNTPLEGTSQGVSIGEEIEYTLNTLLPVALLRNMVIRDILPDGLRCSEAPVLDLGPGGPYAEAGFDPGGIITPTCTDDLVEWNFGNQRITSGTAGLGNRYDFEISFIAQVENTAGTNDGEVITNGGAPSTVIVQYIDEDGDTITQNFGEVDLRVDEPLIDLNKTFAVANADAGDILTVTVTATNNGTATAYNLRVLEDLTGRNMTFTGTVGGANPPDTVDTTTFGANQPLFSWNNGVAAGSSISFSFNVSVDTIVQPEEILDNTIQADWTSLPRPAPALNSSGAIGADGSAAGMRIGELPNAGDPINDYETSAAADIVVPAVTLTKTDLNPDAVPTIGVHKQFRIEIGLPEGITNNVIVTDSLDTAGLSFLLENNATLDITYTFQGIATINGQPAGEAAFNAFPADGTTGSAVWDIGTVVTRTENDPTQSAVTPLIRIEYYARINNDALADAGDTLQNSVVAGYTHGETGVPVNLTDNTDTLTVVEPSLGMTKILENITSPGDSPLAGHTLRYTLTFTAAGGGAGDNFSDAHDLRIDDSLSPGLVYSGNPTVSGAGNTIAAPVVSGDGVTTPQTLRWSLEDGNADIDITEGTQVTVTYEVLVDNSVLIGQTLTNSATAQWTSIDGASTYERNGTATPDYNDYFTGPAATSVEVGNENTTAKTRLLDTYSADAEVRIGDIIEYELRLGLQEGTHNNLIVSDTLPRGLLFEGIAGINGDTAAPYTATAPFVHADITDADIAVAGDAAAGPTTITCTLGDVVNPADGNGDNDDFVIVYRARVLNLVHDHVDTIDLTNTAAMGYETATGPVTGVSVSETVTVRQPNLEVFKSASTADGNTTLVPDEVVTYTVDIRNNGTAPAYDTELGDIIPLGMRNGTATITMVSIELLSAGTTLPNLEPIYDAATGEATWDFDTGTADAYTIPAADTLRIVYQVQADTGLSPGMTLTNQAQVRFYYSFDDDAVPIRGSVTGVREIYGPTDTASTTFNTEDARALDKTNTVSTAAIGEPFAYRITVPATPHDTALHDVRILDDLSDSAVDLSFVRVTKISGTQPWTPVNTGSATNLVIEDTTVGIDIPAGEQIVIEITVRLDDAIPPNASDTPFGNTASYTYNQINDDPGTQADGEPDTADDMNIVGPDDLTMEKSGPAAMVLGTPGAFTLDVHNDGTGTAWNPTIIDLLPNGATGGTCGAGPSNITAEIFESDGTTLVASLEENTDYVVSFSGAPDCQWSLSLLSASGGIPANHRLIINYNAELDPATQNGAPLTNIAGVTQWYSYDPETADAAPRTYTRTLTDGTVGTLDHEDAHTVNTETPVLEFYKHVVNLTTGQDPGLNAGPGDTLRYTLQVINNGPTGLSDFSISDELDNLNTPPLFAAGSLVLVSVPAGAGTSGTDALGGANGTGLVNVDNITIGAQDEDNNTVEVVFDITLAPVIDSGTVVRNQAGLVFLGLDPQLSDDPNIGGATDPTETLIASAPLFQVQKISTYLDGDPTVLMAGETLRYTITIKNIGNENVVNATFRDFTPANTTYVPNSTTLNGNALADPIPGVNPLHSGILINAPENTTPGFMRADAAPEANNVATVTFDVVVDADAMDGLVIENQGFVGGDGVGSGAQPEQPSDDPDTDVPDDPTRDVVGNLPLLYAHKTVELFVDNNGNTFVDPGDVLRYTITISNAAAIDATGVVLTDAVPTNTAYMADSIRLNGAALAPDGGVSPLIAGLPVHSSDNPGEGIVSAGESAVITFEATVNLGVPVGTVISNQGTLTSNELNPQLTDADGQPANGYQPTVIVVGDAQLLTISKAVSVVGGGAALAGGQLEYVIQVTNAGSVAATNMVLTDDLSPPLGTLVTYVAGSGTLDGAAAGVTYAGNMLTADYAAAHGNLAAGDTCVLRFRVRIDASAAIGTTITNTGVVIWNSPAQTDSASVSIDVGGTPKSGTLNGNVWHDANLDAVFDSGELQLAGWSVTLYSNGTPISTETTDAGGAYQFGGLVPNDGSGDRYELRFTALGAGPAGAALGYADSIFTNAPHRISDIVVASGSNLQNLNLPIQPNGTVYDSMVRVPIRGATLTMRNAATGRVVSAQCFDDPNQQNQVTAAEGFYKFDMNFSDDGIDGTCPPGDAYLIEVTPPANGYRAAPSRIIPPESDGDTPAFSVPACPGSAADAVPATPGHCETVSLPAVPPLSVPPRTAGTRYHLHLMLSDGSMPGESQIYNNPIPIDPEMEITAAITKTTSKVNVTRSTLVPYTITVTNVIGVPLYDISISDHFPAGFKYVEGSARLNGSAAEPQINSRELVWDGLELQVDDKIVIQLLLVVGSGVSEGEYVNRAWVFNNAINDRISGEATATVRVIPDPDFDCTDVIGKVFEDADLDGRQDDGEKGLAGVRLVTVRGLIATTDAHGRFHITCAAVPDEDRGSNFILKLDERSLPSGYRLTTENPRVQRATRGKMMRFKFGATIHSVVRMDVADGAFEPGTVELRLQWAGRIDKLMEALQRAPSVLRLAYLGDVESEALVHRRLDVLKDLIKKQWQKIDGGYPLTIETEVFWRRGASFKKR